MSLFNRLLRLHGSSRPTEDFFTEIVGHLLASDEVLVFAWLAEMGLLDGREYDAVEVETQVRLGGKRPDMLIRLTDGTDEDWVMIESKLGAEEGSDQLGKYARIMARQDHVREKHLLFITRDYDPKEPQKVLRGVDAGAVKFRQLRWSDFYRFLQGQAENALVQEALDFMEERRMGEANQFDSASLLTISGIPTVFSLMKSTLDSEVRSKLAAVLGRASYSAMKNISTRYVLQREFDRWYVGVGYYWPDINIGEFPEIRLNINGDIRLRNRTPQVITMIQALTERENWMKDPWLGANRLGAYHKRDLQDFLGEEDHVTAVKGQFLAFIKELAEIKAAYPDVGW